MNNLLSELRRRNIFRVAGVYAVVGWILAQASGVLEDALGLPAWFDTMVVSLLLIGFPIAMLLAWAFEMTPEGVKRTEVVAEGESVTAKTGRTLDYAIVGGLVLVVIVVLGNRLLPQKMAAPDVSVQAQMPNPEADEKLSIAVMPFEDFSSGKDQEYFANGISEELLNVLSRIEGLRVSSRTSAFAFKDRKASTGEIAEALNVGHILEGSIRKAGATLRITAQLIDTKTDEHMWSQTYDRPLTAENIFAIQDEIAAAIVAELKGKLSLTPTKQASRTDSLEAYELYLRARTQMQKRKPDTLRAAEAGFKQVIALDPEFAPAFSGLADTYILMSSYTDMQEDESNALARPNVKRALELAPNSAESLTTAAFFAGRNLEFEKALAFADRAIAANPNYSDAYLRKFIVATNTLTDKQANLAIIQKAQALDPLSAIILNNLSGAQFRAGDIDAAKRTMRDNVRWNPDSPFGLIGLALLSYEDGDIAAAHSLNKDALALNPEFVSVQDSLAGIYMDVGMYDAAFAVSEQPYNRAVVLWLMGQKQQSLKMGLDSPNAGFSAYLLYLHNDLKAAYPQARKFITEFNILEKSADLGTAEMLATIALVLQNNGDADADILMDKVEAYLGSDQRAMDKILASDLTAGIKLQIFKGDEDAAFEWLDRYLGLGFADLPLLQEPVLNSLRGTPKFAEREARMAANVAKQRALIEAQLANPKPNWVKVMP
ncbi:MAG: hypothetical protein COA47_17675 [Robiginitomaculum sp.]|nr:MAG: hypothetical protein COA47_17675 [Robiginitomaculum sp.]